MKWVLLCGYLVSYAIGVSGTAFLDPLLTTHVLYGQRAYPLAPLTVLILAALAISEFVILRRASRTNELYWSLVPFSLAFLVTFPIFLPEFPHGNLAFLYVSALLISAGTIAIQANLEKLCLEPPLVRRNGDMQNDYLKEALSVSKQTMTTLALAFAGSIIAFHSGAATQDNTVVTDPGELFLILSNTHLQFGWITAYFLAGPLLCAFQTTIKLLSQMKQAAQATAEETVSRA